MGIVTFLGVKKVTIQMVVKSIEMLVDVAKRAKTCLVKRAKTW
jgi:hypothetical protein